MRGFKGIVAILTTTTLAGLAVAQAQELRPLVGAVRNVHGIPSDCLLGATGPGGGFVTARDAAPQITASTSIDWYGLAGGQGTGTSHAAEWLGEPDYSSHGTKADGIPEAVGGYVGLAADWPVLPDVLQLDSADSETYRAAAAEYFASVGHDTDRITLQQVIRTDLEGDGVEEVLLTVTDPQRAPDGRIPTTAMAGSHSVILLQRVVDAGVETSLVSGDIHDVPAGVAEEGPHAFSPVFHAVIAVADLNGDGVVEIVGSADYYEGGSIVVYRVDGPQPEEVLSCGEGA